MFTSVVAGLKNGPFKTFTDAFVNFYPRVLAMMEKGAHLDALNNTSWIAGEFDGAKMLLPLYDVRDFAVTTGIVVGEKIQSPLPEIDPRMVRQLFQNAAVTVMASTGHTE